MIGRQSRKIDTKMATSNNNEFSNYKLSYHMKCLGLLISASSTTFILQVLSDATTQISNQQSKDNGSVEKTNGYNDALIHMIDDHTKQANISENLALSSSQNAPLSGFNSRELVMLNQQNSINGSAASNFTSTSEESMKFPLYMRILATFACLLIFIIGVCGNLLVPIVVIKTKYLRNSTNLFLINLAAADLLVLIICEPTVLIELHSRPETWLLGEPMCKLSNFVEMTAANASIFTILAISFERYYAICKPLKAGYKCTRLRATIIICLIWLLSLVLTSPILIMAKSSETIYIDGSLVYNCILETDTYWPKMYVFVSMFAFFCLPLIVLMLVYWLISRRLIRENLAMSATTSLATNESMHHHDGSHQDPNHNQHRCSCCYNENNIIKTKTRSQSLRKAASFKHSVSTFLASRHNAPANDHRQHQKSNQMATQTDLIVVDVSAQSGQVSNKSYLNRAPKLSGEKALSLDHHLIAKVGCNQLPGENNHYHSNCRPAYNSRFANQVRCFVDDIQQENSEETSYNDGASEQKQPQQQQMNILELFKSSGSINSKSFYKFVCHLFQVHSGAGPSVNKQSTSDELTSSTTCHHSFQGKSSVDDISKSTSVEPEPVPARDFLQNVKATTEASEFLMESIREELQPVDFDEFGDKKTGSNDEDLGHHNKNSISDGNRKQDQEVPFLSTSNRNRSIICDTERNAIREISNNRDLLYYGKTVVVDDELREKNKKLRTFSDTAKNLLNGARGTFRFNWPRQASISSSISISTSTQTNTTNLPSEISEGPLSRCDSFNNPQQYHSILNCNGSGFSGSSNGAGSFSGNSASQMVSDSSTPNQVCIRRLHESSEQDQNCYMKRKNRHKLYQRKFAHFESSSSSNTVPDSGTALMVNFNDELRNNQDQIISNSTSSSTTISSSSPYSSKSPSPDSLFGPKKQQSSTKLELDNKKRANITNNSSSSSYKDLLESSKLETEENLLSLSIEQQSVKEAGGGDQLINKNVRISDGVPSTDLAVCANQQLGTERTIISTKPLASPDFRRLNSIAASSETFPNCDPLVPNNHLQDGNDKRNYTIIDTHNISMRKNDLFADNENVIVDSKYRGSEKSTRNILRNRNKSLDLNQKHSSIPDVKDSINKCCNVHNQLSQNQDQHRFRLSFTKRPHWGKRRSNPIICNHYRQNKTHLNELLVVQDISKKQQMDSRRQVVIMLAFVVAAFFLLFFPYRVFTIWLILSTEDQVQSLGMETYYNLTYFSRILIYLHSAINPIAYNLISTKFRRAFMSILLCHGSSDRRYFTTVHGIVNKNIKQRNNSNSDQRKSSKPNRASHQIRSLRL